MKTILFFIESLNGGGAEKVLCTMIKNMDREKFHVKLCCAVNSGSYIEEVRPYVDYSYVFENPASLSGLRLFLFKIKYIILYKWLPLSLFCRFFLPKGSDIEVAYTEGKATKVIAHSANRVAKKIAWLHIDLYNFHWTTIEYSSHKEESDIYKHFDRIVSVSDTVKEAFHKEFPDVDVPVTTLYNPIDSDEIITKSKENVDIEKLHKYTIVSIGRLTKQKAFLRLVKIVERLYKDGFDVGLWILGEGDERCLLEKYIQEHGLNNNVSLLGFKSNPYSYLSKADLFVCSSLSEGYSTAVTEALILGLPIVTTECSGMKELLDGGNTGIITANDEDSLYEGVKTVFEDKDRLKRMRELSLKKGNTLSLTNLVKQIDDYLYEC